MSRLVSEKKLLSSGAFLFDKNIFKSNGYFLIPLIFKGIFTVTDDPLARKTE